MKNYMLLLALIGFIQVFYGQSDFGESGTVYKYLGESQDIPGGPYIATIEFTNDTIITNQECSKVRIDYRVNWGCNGDLNGYKFIYEEDGEVYIFNPATNEFDLLYDFSKNTDESYTIPAFCGGEGLSCDADELVANVDSITFDQVGTSWIRVQHVSVYFPYLGVTKNYSIYDGIGCLEHFFYIPSYYCTTTNDRIVGLRCYDSPTQGILEFFEDAGSCDELVSNVNQHSAKRIDTYPNPFNDRISISLDGHYDINLYAVNGAKVFMLQNQQGDTSVNTDSLKQGVYILNIKFNGLSINRKMVKR